MPPPLPHGIIKIKWTFMSDRLELELRHCHVLCNLGNPLRASISLYIDWGGRDNSTYA